MPIFNFTELDLKQLSEREQFFQNQILRQHLAEEAWVELYDYFLTQKFNFNKQTKLSYWRWFVILTLKRNASLSEEGFTDLIIGKQVLTAILVDYDLVDLIIWYLYKNYDFPDAMGVFMVKAQKMISSSTMEVGSWRDKSVTIAECFEQMKLLRSYNYDSIKMAEFESKLKQIIFPKPEADLLFYEYFTVDPNTAVRRFVDLMDFFLSVGPDEIWKVVDEFIHKELGEKETSSVAESPTTLKTTISAQKPEVLKPILPQVLTVVEIRNQIDAQFKKDSSGNYQDIGGVLEKLSELSQKYNDPKIAEMLYFDEEKNKFVWQ